MNVPRRYYACRKCGWTCCPWDQWAGVGSIQVTSFAQRMICTVATAWSFDRSAAKLKTLCSIHVSDDTIERVCQHQGEKARHWLRGASETVELFDQAPGDPEFYSDGLKINTTDGWREMRLNLLQKRERATPSTPEQWKQRVLPDANVRLASCCIADSRLTGALWKQWSERMKLSDSSNLSVLADGAPWIWEQAKLRLSPQAQWCVDIYHVSEHLHDCAKKMLGDTPAARTWADHKTDRLIELGGPAFIDELQAEHATAAEPSHHAPLTSLLTYLIGNRDRMWYAERLAQGKPIGSGAIEGACKKIGQRLKLNSARWRVRRAERFGAMLCLDYTDQADAYWKSNVA